MIKYIAIFVICIFIGVGIFAFAKAISLFQSKEALQWEIENTYKPQFAQLSKEHSQLKDKFAQIEHSLTLIEEENRVTKDTLQKNNARIEEYKSELGAKDTMLTEANSRLGQAQEENSLLKEKINAMFIEFYDMKKALASVDALKERIRELQYGKKKTSDGQPGAGSVAAGGNKGYLVRDGKSTFVPRVKIQVRPTDG